MYNYLGVLKKSTAIEHCISCNFFDIKSLNLILSKNNRLEFYSLSEEEGLIAKKYINIYGKIKILLKIPSKKGKDNLFVLSQDLNFSLFSYDSLSNNINIPISGTIKEDLGKVQEEILYCLDNNKNYLLICAYKNIFKIICVNIDMNQFDKYKNYTIRFQYEKIMFLAPFYLGDIDNKDLIDNDDILNFVVIKQVYDDKNILKKENYEIKKDIVMETFQIKIQADSFDNISDTNKKKVVSNGKITNLKVNSKLRKIINNTDINNSNTNEINNKKKNVNNNIIEKNQTIVYNYEKLVESVNFLEVINIEEDQKINLIITHPDGIIILFFSSYVIYYQYNNTNKSLTCSKSVSYNKKTFIDYITADEKNYKYYVIDELGSLYSFGFLLVKNKNTENKEKIGMILQFIGKVNPPSCMAYLNNNILFIGSIKSNSQLIKINENIEQNDIDFQKIEIIEEYESLSPISNMLLLNNTKEENGIEIMTVSGIGSNCSVKNIKRGTCIIYNGEIEIKDISQVFKVIINSIGNKKKTKTQNYCSFIITTTMKSFIINYDYKSKIVSLNTSINFEQNEKVLFAKNIKNIIIIVTNINIYTYQNDSKLSLLSEIKINVQDKIPLIIKYNKNLQGLFVYFSDNNLIKYHIDINDGKIMENELILNDISISAFDLCKKFLIFSNWDNNKLGVYTFNNKKVNYIDLIEDSINFVYISSVQIIKLNDQYNIFLSLSFGKLIYLKLNKQINSLGTDYEFKTEDFVIKQSYNINLENFSIKKVKNDSNKFLFLDTSLPCLINFNHENLIISNFNANNCKDIISLDNFEKNFLFVFNNKISFGAFSNNQNQNIYTLKSGKTINNMKLIDFSKSENNKRINSFKQKKYILTIEETENSKTLNSSNENIMNSINSSLILNDMNMKEIARYNFEYENELSMNLTEVDLMNSEIIRKKYFVVGTGITDDNKTEPKIGHLYLMEINFENNFGIKKLQEIETKGGVYSMDCYKNFIYVGIKDTLYIYSLSKKSHENYYEFKLIRQHSDFDLINHIYVGKYILYQDEEDEDKEKDNKEKNMEIENSENKEINEIYVCDIYKTIILYRYDIINDKLKEISRDNNPTWVYSILQYQKNLLYATDIDNNIITLKKLYKVKNQKEKIKLDQVSNFNFGERITCLIPTQIENKNLSSLTSYKDTDDLINEGNDYNIVNNNDKVKVTYFGTMEGTVGYIIALNKHVYEFLYFLQELLIKKANKIGNFNYKIWRSSKDGYNVIESKGFIEGDIIKEFLNYDDDYKKLILKELNYPWKKSVKEVVNIIETLNNFY